MIDDICSMDGASLVRSVKSRAISPVEIVEAVLDRMDRLDPSIHAFCTPTPDIARRDARRLEAKIMAGHSIGPLAGIAMGVKDLILTKGIRTTFGSYAYRDFVPEEDDVVIERLRRGDAIILGKTNVPEFGYSAAGHNPIFETTANPWNLACTSGGSSAGSAAAVAAGMGPAALGSDGGGSIRIPSAHCGTYGMKPSMGRVPLYPGCRDDRYPGASSWESLEHIGPITRTVADAALVLSAIAGPDDRDRHSRPQADFDWLEATSGGVEGLRVAFTLDWGYAAVDPEVRRIVTQAVMVFENDLGCRVQQDNPGWGDPWETFWTLVAMESDLVGMRHMADELGSRMSPHLVEFLHKAWSAEDFTNAVTRRKEICNKMWKFMRRYDLLLTPTVAVPPFPLNVQGPERIDGQMVESSAWIPFTFPINMTGQPAASVPAGWTDNNLPVGLQIIGRHLADETVLRASAAFEAAAPWRDRWPPIISRIAS